MYEYKVINGYTEAYEKTDVCLEDELNAWAKDGYRFVANLTFHKHATRRVLLMEREVADAD